MFVFKNITIQHFTCPKSHSPNVLFCPLKEKSDSNFKKPNIRTFQVFQAHDFLQNRTIKNITPHTTKQHVLSSFDISSYPVIIYRWSGNDLFINPRHGAQ